ncbi:MAG: DUF2007 domain-containing protein [Bacteroidales bacterium]|nr:DUF2007 domain-containing protein [Bacteroidales bacterium]
MKTIRLITCDNTFDAHSIKNQLEENDIECILTNENFTNLMPHFNNIMGTGIHIFIFEKDLAKAKEIIKEKLNGEEVNPICPFCGSADIHLGLGNHKWLKRFNIFIALLMLLPIGNLKPKYYCRSCKNEIA